MVKNDEMISVTNRSRGSVGYQIPDMGNLQRHFTHGETKMISAEEIRKLEWTPGGHVLLRDSLIIGNPELAEELLHEVQPEYTYSEEKIKEVLLSGSMDEFMDFIDFAPEGAIQLMKDMAIKLEAPDVRKRDALSKKTNTDINNAIRINQESKVDEQPAEATVKQRRVPVNSGNTTTTTTGRRTQPSLDNKYKVVSK